VRPGPRWRSVWRDGLSRGPKKIGRSRWRAGRTLRRAPGAGRISVFSMGSPGRCSSADWQSADLSRLGSGQRDCPSAGRARPAGPQPGGVIEPSADFDPANAVDIRMHQYCFHALPARSRRYLPRGVRASAYARWLRRQKLHRSSRLETCATKPASQRDPTSRHRVAVL